MATSHGEATPSRPERVQYGRDSPRSVRVSSIRSLTNPLFDDGDGLILIKFDELDELALRSFVALREERFQIFVALGVRLDQEVPARRNAKRRACLSRGGQRCRARGSRRGQ